jgi:hypothetical protein
VRRRREDGDDVGASADLAVEALKRVRRSAAWGSARRETRKRENVVFGVLEQRRELRQAGLELRDGVAEAPARFAGVRGAEQLADEGAERVVLVLVGVAAEISEEVHRAALPRRPDDPRDRGLQAGCASLIFSCTQPGRGRRVI